MRNLRSTVSVAALLAGTLLSSAAFAADPDCGVASTCSISSQTMGDTTQTADSENSGSSQATNLGNSSAGNNASGAASTESGDAMTSSGAATTTSGAIDTDLNAIGNDNRSQGGAASTGAIDNKSSVGNTSTGASTATNGGMTGFGGSAANGANTNGANTNGANTNGDMTGIVGPSTALSGSNIGDTSAKVGDTKATVGDLSTGASTSGALSGSLSGSSIGDTKATNGDVTGTIKSDNKNGDVTGTQLQGQQARTGDVSGKQDTKVANGSSSGSASNSGGNTLSTGSNSAAKGGNQAQSNDNSGNSSTKVDASNHSNYKSIFIPTVTQITPPSTVAIGNIIKETTACGPLQAVVKTPILGTFNGLFRQSTIQQGYTYDLTPFYDKAGVMLDRMEVTGQDGVVRVFGHQAIIFSTVLGVSGNRNINLGGGGDQGAWGQAGMGSSASNTQLVTNIQLKMCELGAYKTVEVVREVEVEKKKGDQ